MCQGCCIAEEAYVRRRRCRGGDEEAVVGDWNGRPAGTSSSVHDTDKSAV